MQKINPNLKKALLLWSVILLVVCSISAQEMMLNPTTTAYGIVSDIPEFICPEFDIEEMKTDDSIDAIS